MSYKEQFAWWLWAAVLLMWLDRFPSSATVFALVIYICLLAETVWPENRFAQRRNATNGIQLR